MEKVLSMTYASSLTDLCEVNSSFDSGILRICYTGQNRNNSFLSKQVIEQNIQTIYNCPIVCNYDREKDTLGAHDVEVVRDEDGQLRLVNLTQPIGIIPESAKVWFENYEEKDGTIHEYLYAEVLLWKRQEAYKKIKNDGITAHSMEITVKDGVSIDGVYHINDFEFTAFALIGTDPCFESSALETFSKSDFKEQFSEMMNELKETFTKVNSTVESGQIHSQNYSKEGGESALEDKNALVAEYGINADTLDFSIVDSTVEELTEKLEEIKKTREKQKDNRFALTENIVRELERVLSTETVTLEWGECQRYYYVDCDIELNEVYCWDANDGKLYGFIYSINGDEITIDYESRKRKKYVITDFIEAEQSSPDAEQSSPFDTAFGIVEETSRELTEIEAKYNAASEKLRELNNEVDTLRKFKANAENAIAKEKREAVFAQFSDLNGIEAFETLRSDCMKYDVETLEEKCFAIRGRNGSIAKFSLESKAPKIKVEKTDIETDEPYGGLFIKYKTGSGSN